MDGENRRSHKLAPFVRQNPVSMSEMAIFQQQSKPSPDFSLAAWQMRMCFGPSQND